MRQDQLPSGIMGISGFTGYVRLGEKVVPKIDRRRLKRRIMANVRNQTQTLPVPSNGMIVPKVAASLFHAMYDITWQLQYVACKVLGIHHGKIAIVFERDEDKTRFLSAMSSDKPPSFDPKRWCTLHDIIIASKKQVVYAAGYGGRLVGTHEEIKQSQTATAPTEA